MEKLNVTVNGKFMSVDVDPSIRLVDFLRENLFLTGTKIGCGKGECGACTVIMNGKAVTSCVLPVMRAQNAVIETIEGVAKDGKLHPIQEEFINKGAIQWRPFNGEWTVSSTNGGRKTGHPHIKE